MYKYASRNNTQKQWLPNTPDYEEFCGCNEYEPNPIKDAAHHTLPRFAEVIPQNSVLTNTES